MHPLVKRMSMRNREKALLLLLVVSVITSCHNLPGIAGRYSNITTSGAVYGRNGEPVENMVILIQSDSLAINDTAITDAEGRFFRSTAQVPYPFPEVKVIAIDLNEVIQPYALENKYLSDTLSTRYLFDCGTNASPVEKDWAFNSEELNFFFGLDPKEITSPAQAASLLQGEWAMVWEQCYGYDDYHEKYGYTNGYDESFAVDHSPLHWVVAEQTIQETYVAKGDTLHSTKQYAIEKSESMLEPFMLLLNGAKQSDYGRSDNVMRLKFLSTALVEIHFSSRSENKPEYIRRLQRTHSPQ